MIAHPNLGQLLFDPTEQSWVGFLRIEVVFASSIRHAPSVPGLPCLPYSVIVRGVAGLLRPDFIPLAWTPAPCPDASRYFVSPS